MQTVGSGNAGGFLAAMLEGVKAEIGLARGIGMAMNGDYAAFLVQFVAAGDQLQGLED
jgi:hypothetical protein